MTALTGGGTRSLCTGEFPSQSKVSERFSIRSEQLLSRKQVSMDQTRHWLGMGRPSIFSIPHLFKIYQNIVKYPFPSLLSPPPSCGRICLSYILYFSIFIPNHFINSNLSPLPPPPLVRDFQCFHFQFPCILNINDQSCLLHAKS